MAVDTRSLDYKTVSVDKREIRLLEIQTGRDIHDPIVSRLVNVRVTEDLEFVGLAALLGDFDHAGKETISVNGCKISVPATIGQALRHTRALFLREQGLLYHTVSNSSSTSSSPRPQTRHRKTPAWFRQILRGFRSISPEASASSFSRGTPLRVFLDCICMNLCDPREGDQRRAMLALAYGSAIITVGWLGPKDETSDMAIQMLRELDAVYPPNFGHPLDKLEHPENYSPVMKWIEPVGTAWLADGDVNGDPEQGPMYIAASKFLARPFFQRTCKFLKNTSHILIWRHRLHSHNATGIMEELSLSRFPAFLLGDEIVSWMQMLQWNRMNEEFEKAGSQYIPKQVEAAVKKIAKVDLRVVHIFLDELERRRAKNDKRGLPLTAGLESPAETRPATAMSNTHQSRNISTRSLHAK